MIAAIIEPSRAMGGRHPFPGPSKEENWGVGACLNLFGAEGGLGAFWVSAS